MSLLVLTVFFGLNIWYKYKAKSNLNGHICIISYVAKFLNMQPEKKIKNIKPRRNHKNGCKCTYILRIIHKEKIRLSIDFMITCYICSGSLHIRSYCVRSPWYWISVTRLVFYLYCVNFVIYWKYFVSDILRLHMTFMTLGSFCLVVKMKIFTVIHILTQENWKKVYIFDHCVHYRLQNS